MACERMTISFDKDANFVVIDGKAMATNELKVELLDEIVVKSLEGKVDYAFPDDCDKPIVDFFRVLQRETAPGSKLYDKSKEIDAAIAAADEQGKVSSEENADD